MLWGSRTSPSACFAELKNRSRPVRSVRSPQVYLRRKLRWFVEFRIISVESIPDWTEKGAESVSDYVLPIEFVVPHIFLRLLCMKRIWIFLYFLLYFRTEHLKSDSVQIRYQNQVQRKMLSVSAPDLIYVIHSSRVKPLLRWNSDHFVRWFWFSPSLSIRNIFSFVLY